MGRGLADRPHAQEHVLAQTSAALTGAVSVSSHGSVEGLGASRRCHRPGAALPRGRACHEHRIGRAAATASGSTVGCYTKA
ncbi:hypothetical protein NDU88_002057 [Pleurodeles waltl]|uniref:Uncharacterized protein n=1 Tax=Pleurodeles waltl TaxID=8319 RepID=A0AAV7MMR1_PLEWA|nr:hypothetical protein NDU88_002057 [Pleurodeles waltl]